jgi:uncharacterized membrane protein YesL
VADYFLNRAWPRLIGCLIALLAIVLLLNLMTGFPASSTRQAFGGAPPLLAIALMFIGVLSGIAATYIFNLSGVFSWRDFARPLVASVQGAELEPIQLVSFTILAFQNGFFWQQVLKDAKPTH